MMQNCNRYITGKEQPEKEDFDKINLLRFVSEDTPPAFLFHLCADPIVKIGYFVEGMRLLHHH